MAGAGDTSTLRPERVRAVTVADASLSHYRITSLLGSGGMGEVYRATDTRLGRDVALKLLPADVAGDAERLARFEREARLLAALNHPGIAHVYGFEMAARADGSTAHFLAMELVEGEELAERLRRGSIPFDEALVIAKQIAEALEEAHEKGIVHRDLKPANIKLTPDGKVKVLDFGLAKAYSGDAASGPSAETSQSPTLIHTGTRADVILGTAAYMSPEQARGRAIDKRSDIWAFGVVLFEMLTGRRPFDGETTSEILAAVIKDEPAWDELPPNLPHAAGRILRRCLVKDPRQRLHDIADVRILFEEADRDTGQRTVAPAIRGPRWRERVAWLFAVAGLGLAAALAWRASASPPDEPLTHFSMALPGDHRLAFRDVPILALSRDGRKLAFSVSGPADETMIYVRAFDQPDARPVAGTEDGTSPFFSPDGSALAFFAGGRLKVVSLGGGSPVSLADAPNNRGGVWDSDGSILYSPDFAGGLWRVPATGGASEPAVLPETAKGERTYRWPDLLPGGRAVLFTVGSLDSPNDYDEARIVAYSFETRQRHLLVEGGNMARFVPPGTLVYSRGGVLFAVPFDADRLEVTGPPAPVLEDVAADPSSGASYFAVASGGTLAVVRGAGSEVNRRLTIVDRKGIATPLPLSPRGFRHPRFSPDGTRLAFAVGSASGVGADADVWVYSLASGSLSRLTFDRNVYYGLWTPEGDRITYMRTTDQALYTRPADGSGSESRVTPANPQLVLPSSYSPDGRTLALTRLGASTDIYLIAADASRLFEKDASAPAFSPDGRWIAYASPSAGSSNVFVRPVTGEGKWQVSSDYGGYPRWSADGQELLYIAIRTPNRPLLAVPITGGARFKAGSPRTVIADSRPYLTSTAPQIDWDADPAGDRFVFIQVEREKDEGTRIDVALHWARHLPLGRAFQR